MDGLSDRQDCLAIEFKRGAACLTEHLLGRNVEGIRTVAGRVAAALPIPGSACLEVRLPPGGARSRGQTHYGDAAARMSDPRSLSTEP
jgi:hypothetical protein